MFVGKISFDTQTSKFMSFDKYLSLHSFCRAHKFFDRRYIWEVRFLRLVLEATNSKFSEVDEDSIYSQMHDHDFDGSVVLSKTISLSQHIRSHHDFLLLLMSKPWRTMAYGRLLQGVQTAKSMGGTISRELSRAFHLTLPEMLAKAHSLEALLSRPAKFVHCFLLCNQQHLLGVFRRGADGFGALVSSIPSLRKLKHRARGQWWRDSLCSSVLVVVVVRDPSTDLLWTLCTCPCSPYF